MHKATYAQYHPI